MNLQKPEFVPTNKKTKQSKEISQKEVSFFDRYKAPSGKAPLCKAPLRKAPSRRELAPKATEGERVTIKLIKTPKSRRLLPSRLRRATADCQASATPKNASKGESHPKHFLGLKLIDKTIFCKVSLSKE